MGLKGIKLHPTYQNTYIDDIRYERIIGYAVELGLLVSIHCGRDLGLSLIHIWITLHAEEPESRVMYYDYSTDGGTTYSRLLSLIHIWQLASLCQLQVQLLQGFLTHALNIQISFPFPILGNG